MTKALIGAGCFWGIEEYYRKITGIIETKVGYSGGKTSDPTYEEVCKGITDHAEVVNISFNENILSYEEIINHFWLCHDSTQLNKQGFDIGSQYRSVIFCYSEEQKNIAMESKKLKQHTLSNKIVTEIINATTFYLAEDYHQLFIKKRD